MPKGPKGQKRPADAVGAAITVAKLATGEIEEKPEDDGKDKAAQALGRKGGAARAKKLSKKRRAEIAKKAAKTRWRSRETPNLTEYSRENFRKLSLMVWRQTLIY